MHLSPLNRKVQEMNYEPLLDFLGKTVFSDRVSIHPEKILYYYFNLYIFFIVRGGGGGGVGGGGNDI